MATTIGLASYGIVMSDKASQRMKDLDNQYDRAYYDLTSYMDNVEALLAKSIIVSHPENTSETLEQIWKQADLAQENLNTLPAGQHVFAGTSKFLNQLSNLAMSANYALESSGSIPENYKSELISMHQYCMTLVTDLHDMESLINGNSHFWDKFQAKDNAGMEENIFVSMDSHLAQIPEIVYDGQYSDHLTSSTPKGLTGGEVTKEQAMEILRSIIEETGVTSSEIVCTDISEGMIPSYNMEITMDDGSKASASITRQGGMLLWYLWNRDSTAEVNISLAAAQAYGAEFLQAIGYENMIPTHGETIYNSTTGNVITVNYCYEQDGVKVYPDLVKLRIDGTDGTIVGVEANGYLNCHTERTLNDPSVSEAQALEHISDDVTINSIYLAIIPTDYSTEVMVYEVSASYNDKSYLIYINAETGREEEIIVKVEE